MSKPTQRLLEVEKRPESAFSDSSGDLSNDNFVEGQIMTSGGSQIHEKFLQWFSLTLWVFLLSPIVLKFFRIPLPDYFGIPLASWAWYGILAVMFNVLAKVLIGLMIRWLKSFHEMIGSDLASNIEEVIVPLSTLVSTTFFAITWYSMYPASCPPEVDTPNLDQPGADVPISDLFLKTLEGNNAAAINGLVATMFSTIIGKFCIFDFISKFMASIMVCSMVFIIEMVLLRMGLWRFLRNYFQDRILESRYQCYVVQALRFRIAGGLSSWNMAGPRTRSKISIGFPLIFPFRVPIIDSLVNWLNSHLVSGVSGMEEVEQGARPMALQEFNHRLLGIIQHQGLTLVANSPSVLPQLDSESRNIAKDLFTRLCPKDRDYLIPSDFQPIFQGHAATRDAYYIFDRDQDGTITKTEFRHTVVSVYRDQRNLAKSVKDASQVFNKLATAIHGFIIVALFFCCLAIFGVKVQSLFAVIISLTFGLNVIFGSVVKRSFQGIIFLFVDHPYDVGDKVVVGSLNEPDPLVVRQITMTTTVFHRWNGQEIYVPNANLAGATIYNVSRSAEQWERIDFQVRLTDKYEDERSSSSKDRIGIFRDMLEAFLKSRSGDFLQNADLRPVIYGDLGKSEDTLEAISMTLRIQCKASLDPQKRWARHNRLLAFIRDALGKSGMELKGNLITQH